MLNDFSPAIAYFKRLRYSDPIVPKQTSHARVLSGELPICRTTRAGFSSSGRQNIAVGDMVHLRIAEGALLTLQEP